jgi:hypothetical protein
MPDSESEGKVIVIRNQHTSPDGFMMVSDQLPNSLQTKLHDMYQDLYRAIEVVFDVTVSDPVVTYNKNLDLYERRITIANLESKTQGKEIIYYWFKNTKIKKFLDSLPGGRNGLRNRANCSLDIFIIDRDAGEYIEYQGDKLVEALNHPKLGVLRQQLNKRRIPSRLWLKMMKK